MNELYELIEKKIKASGYPRPISGADVYDDICDQIDGKENGTYLLLSKFEEDVVFEYHITIRDEDFNLGVLTMKTPEHLGQEASVQGIQDRALLSSLWNSAFFPGGCAGIQDR